MKETHYFYDPDLCGKLYCDEAKHALRVLRLVTGDLIHIVDGQGHLCQAEIIMTRSLSIIYRIVEIHKCPRPWQGHLHIAIAPTKQAERMEWVVEKATEIGFDELTFLNCDYSERHRVNMTRIERIIISAMKQSHSAWKPQVNNMTFFNYFMQEKRAGQRFICHCHEGEKPLLFSMLDKEEDATVLIGPEGDFSEDEVRVALQHGFRPASLGHSRLRTETAALVATHLMNITHTI